MSLTQQYAWQGSLGAANTFGEFDEVLPGVTYGRPEQILSPAYWTCRAENTPEAEMDFSVSCASLAEELVFCLLGGFGIKLELARAYFERFLDNGVICSFSPPSAEELEALLREPVSLGGKLVRYRFPVQKSSRIAGALAQLRQMEFDESDAIELRNSLLKIAGVGPKTASWIVRNYLGSDEVAILDIHIMRACWVMKLFPKGAKLPIDYIDLEEKFVLFSKLIGVRASLLDALMWSDIRTIGVHNIEALRCH